MSSVTKSQNPKVMIFMNFHDFRDFRTEIGRPGAQSLPKLRSLRVGAGLLEEAVGVSGGGREAPVMP